MIRNDLIIEDTTLRDGEQTPSVAFSKKAKLRIHDLLVESGVKWIEVGIPAMGGDEVDFLQTLVARGSDAKLVAWNRGVLEDIKQSLDMGFDAIHIGLPTSNIHIEQSIGKSRDWLMVQAQELIKYAKDRGAFVSISAEDVGRTENSFLTEYAGVVHAAGADRLRLSDTIGILTPEIYAEKVRIVRAIGIDVHCHTHNDFGLALANLLEGLKQGARYFHVTVNAMGERAGMTDIVQAYMTLKHLYNIDLGLKGSKLQELSEYVAEVTKAPLIPWHPITGKNVFAHESGIHVNGMLKDTKTFEPFSPEEFNRERTYVIGKHSGRNILLHFLRNGGYDPTQDELAICLQRVREYSVARGTSLTVQQLIELYEEVKLRSA